MTQQPSERLSQLLKLPAQSKMARDFLRRKMKGDPAWGQGGADALIAAGEDARRLAAWCEAWLSREQLQQLRKALRLAANQQRVYKRTVMLSPRAHLLVKTLAEQEGLRMSDVIELHLDQVLRERFGLTIRTHIDEQVGEVEHQVVLMRDEP